MEVPATTPAGKFSTGWWFGLGIGTAGIALALLTGVFWHLTGVKPRARKRLR